MQKYFEGSTKAEALALADAWWRQQAGLSVVLRVTLPVDDASSTRWQVVVHYRPAVAAPIPDRGPNEDLSQKCG